MRCGGLAPPRRARARAREAPARPPRRARVAAGAADVRLYGIGADAMAAELRAHVAGSAFTTRPAV